MDIVIMIVIGFVVGLIARALIPGDRSMGIILTTILGIVGGVMGGYLGRLAGWYETTWLTAILGAMLLLFIVGLIMRKTGHHGHHGHA
jgi:uncharacterized membrane protein YeaQ/YmgE (transglycosylase-associated protein family)